MLATVRPSGDGRGIVIEPPFVRARRDATDQKEAIMGMIKKLMASGIAAKVISEARKPANQAKIKKAIADFQAKRGGKTTPR
jgi:hypothetical protein